MGERGEDDSKNLPGIQLRLLMMNQLEMLTAREQLMEDIDCIIEGRFSEVFPHTEDYEELRDELVETLCDAVCRNFPSN